MALEYGIKAIHPSADSSRPHILGFNTARSAADDTLLEIWNGTANTARKAVIDLEGKFYSASYAAGSMLYAVAGSVTGVQRMDALAIGAANAVMITDGSVPSWSLTLAGLTSVTSAVFVGPLTGNVTGNVSGTAPAGSLTGATLAAGVTASSLTSVGGLSSLAVTGTSAFTGNVGIGAAANVAKTLYALRSVAASGAGQFGADVRLTLTGAGSTGPARGLNVTGGVNSTSGTQSGGVYGTYATVALAGNGGTTTNAYGALTYGSVGAGHTCTNMYLMYIQEASAGGTLTNEYGLYIEGILAGGTLNYAIYTNSGICRFGAEVNVVGDFDHDGTNVGFYGTAPAAQQDITGSRAGNAALADLLTSLALIGLITDSSS